MKNKIIQFYIKIVLSLLGLMNPMLHPMQQNPGFSLIEFDKAKNLYWLEVPGFNDSVCAEIKKAADGSVSSIAYKNRFGHQLATGLYLWKSDFGAGRKDSFRPSAGNKEKRKSGSWFTYDKKLDRYVGKNKKRYDLNKQKHLHPAKEISDILAGRKKVRPSSGSQGDLKGADAFIFSRITDQGAPLSVKSTYPRKDFFKNIVGMSEKDFIDLIKNGNKPSGRVALRTYAEGKFCELSLEQINDAIKKIPAAGGKGRLHVVEGVDPKAPSWFRRFIDIGALQLDHSDGSAAFQLASNFHCLEARCSPLDARNGNLYTLVNNQYMHGLEEMAERAVQGENGAISAAPGVIHKMYYHAIPNLVGNFSQTVTIQGVVITIPVSSIGKIDYSLDHDVPKRPFKGKNPPLPSLSFEHSLARRLGKPFTQNPQFPSLSEDLLDDPEFVQEFINRVNIGYLAAVEVTGGLTEVNQGVRKGDNDNEAVDPLHNARVDQIFSAALDLKGRRPGSRKSMLNERCYDEKSVQASVLARLLLIATYEGAIKAAWAYGKKSLYLTLVGAGDFQNDLTWVSDALVRCKQAIIDSGMDVYVIVYDAQRDALTDGHQYRLFQMTLGDLVSEMGGSYIRYQEDGAYSPTGAKQDAWLMYKLYSLKKELAKLRGRLRRLAFLLERLKNVLPSII